MNMRVLVTGGAGFIGSAVVRSLINAGKSQVVNLDKLTYAANLNNLVNFTELPEYTFERLDICNQKDIRAVFQRHRPNLVMHLAAETHVDRSIDGPTPFVQTNVVGTYNLLEAALDYFRTLVGSARETFRFLHVSTDEVFGSLDDDGLPFTSKTPYGPRSPYSATKAASDHLALAWYHTYGLPVLISN